MIVSGYINMSTTWKRGVHVCFIAQLFMAGYSNPSETKINVNVHRLGHWDMLLN